MVDSVILTHADNAETDFLIYTGNFCGYCQALKRLLERHQFSYIEYNFDQYPGLREQVVGETGHRTVPVVFDLRSGEPKFIGGFDQTNAMLRRKFQAIL
ncbi:MAG: glutaredoxin, partial [archaeon]|nr:glutaredoxin [archaeon]